MMNASLVPGWRNSEFRLDLAAEEPGDCVSTDPDIDRFKGVL